MEAATVERGIYSSFTKSLPWGKLIRVKLMRAKVSLGD